MTSETTSIKDGTSYIHNLLFISALLVRSNFAGAGNEVVVQFMLHHVAVLVFYFASLACFRGRLPKSVGCCQRRSLFRQRKADSVCVSAVSDTAPLCGCKRVQDSFAAACGPPP